jgi:hypothetical protein
MKKHITLNGQTLNEIQILAKIVTLMNNHGYYMWRHHNAGSFNAKEAGERIVDLYRNVKDGWFSKEHFEEAVNLILSDCWRTVPLQKKGVFDLVGFRLDNGRFTTVELKIGADVLSPDQKVFFEVCRQSNCETWIVKDFPAFSNTFFARKNQAVLS